MSRKARIAKAQLVDNGFVFVIVHPMKPADRALQLLRGVEGDLRKLLSEAATTGDYAAVLQLAGWARTLAEIVGPQSRKVHSSHMVTGSRGPTHVESRPQPLTADRRINASTAYPRFHRDGDRLVRVAWSKGDKREYEHKASHSVLTALAAAMVERGTDGRVFSSDEILPIRESDGTEVPSYQAYVGIALLKRVGLIDQHGRRGYSIPRLPEFKSEVEALWQSLPEK